MGLVQQGVIVREEGVADAEVPTTDVGNRLPAVGLLQFMAQSLLDNISFT